MEITFTVKRSAATNEFVVEHKNRLDNVKSLRDETYGGLAATKITLDRIMTMMAREINTIEPDIITMRNKLSNMIAEITETDDIIDILRFVDTVVTTPKVHDPIGTGTDTFKDNGDYSPYDPVKEKSMYHNCDNACTHKCEHPDCDRIVQYHDEPWCFTHSPDSGSSVAGYDSRKGNIF